MKRSMFLNVIKGENAYLLHNTLYGTLVKAKCDGTKSIANRMDKEICFEYRDSNTFHRALKDAKMIVPDDVNEMNLLNYHFFEKNRDELIIILFVTRQCNFRCVYCYENHENKKMSPEVYENLERAIKKEVEAKGYKKVVLSFFGGEPMLEYESICAFMQKMLIFANESNISVYGIMTTNAYLLSLEKLRELVGLKVLYYQITVDGVKKIHDGARFLVGGGGTWDKIIQNLKDAKNSELNFNILLRYNFDSDAIENIKEYFEFLIENFSEDKRFKMHLEAVKKLDREAKRSLNKNDRETEALPKISTWAKELKIDMFSSVSAPFDTMCYASKNNSLAVDTDGTLMKCTVCIDSDKNKVGKLSDRGFEIDDTKICNWTSYNLPKECASCKILPLCFGRKCPMSIRDSNSIDRTYCLKNISYYENSMKNVYQINGNS